MDINEAMGLLEKNSITSSKQMLRRWIRQGKIKASIKSKKEGYVIDAASLESFIREKQKNNQGHTQLGFEEGYKEGYTVALRDVSERFRKMAYLGMYEQSFPIYRSEFRDLCSSRISKPRLKDFLAFTDRKFFAKQVSKPRSKIWCNSIGNYFYFQNVGLLIDQEEYEYDLELELEYQAYDILIKELLKIFIKEDKVTSNVND